jgi:hypothetical protein
MFSNLLLHEQIYVEASTEVGLGILCCMEIGWSKLQKWGGGQEWVGCLYTNVCMSYFIAACWRVCWVSSLLGNLKVMGSYLSIPKLAVGVGVGVGVGVAYNM